MPSFTTRQIRLNKDFWKALSQLSQSMANFSTNSPEGISASQFVQLGKTLNEIAKNHKQREL